VWRDWYVILVLDHSEWIEWMNESRGFSIKRKNVLTNRKVFQSIEIGVIACWHNISVHVEIIACMSVDYNIASYRTVFV